MPRKQKKYHFIYKTTNLLSGKYYIGMHSTDDLNDGYMGSGKRLRYSLNKYGKDNHKVEILEFFDTRKALAAREKEVVCLNEIAKEECMNLKVGGEGGGGFISIEQQRYRSQCGGKAHADRIKTDIQYRNEFINRVSKFIIQANNEGKTSNSPRFSNLKHSEETKSKLSKKMLGKGIAENNSQFGTCWVTKNNINKKIKLTILNEYLNSGWKRGRV